MRRCRVEAVGRAGAGRHTGRHSAIPHHAGGRRRRRSAEAAAQIRKRVGRAAPAMARRRGVSWHRRAAARCAAARRGSLVEEARRRRCKPHDCPGVEVRAGSPLVEPLVCRDELRRRLVPHAGERAKHGGAPDGAAASHELHQLGGGAAGRLWGGRGGRGGSRA